METPHRFSLNFFEKQSADYQNLSKSASKSLAGLHKSSEKIGFTGLHPRLINGAKISGETGTAFDKAATIAARNLPAASCGVLNPRSKKIKPVLKTITGRPWL